MEWGGGGGGGDGKAEGKVDVGGLRVGSREEERWGGRGGGGKGMIRK